MKIWRIQHQCEHPHGPMGSCRRGIWDCNAPAYGNRLEPPQMDPSLAHMTVGRQEYIFGVLEDKFPEWWSDDAPESLSDDWYAVLYEVEDDAAVVGRNQVMFDSYRCFQVYQTQTDFPRAPKFSYF